MPGSGGACLSPQCRSPRGTRNLRFAPDARVRLRAEEFRPPLALPRCAPARDMAASAPRASTRWLQVRPVKKVARWPPSPQTPAETCLTRTVVGSAGAPLHNMRSVAGAGLHRGQQNRSGDVLLHGAPSSAVRIEGNSLINVNYFAEARQPWCPGSGSSPCGPAPSSERNSRLRSVFAFLGSICRPQLICNVFARGVRTSAARDLGVGQSRRI